MSNSGATNSNSGSGRTEDSTGGATSSSGRDHSTTTSPESSFVNTPVSTMSAPVQLGFRFTNPHKQQPMQQQQEQQPSKTLVTKGSSSTQVAPQPTATPTSSTQSAASISTLPVAHAGPKSFKPKLEDKQFIDRLRLGSPPTSLTNTVHPTSTISTSGTLPHHPPHHRLLEFRTPVTNITEKAYALNHLRPSPPPLVRPTAARINTRFQAPPDKSLGPGSPIPGISDSTRSSSPVGANSSPVMATPSSAPHPSQDPERHDRHGLGVVPEEDEEVDDDAIEKVTLQDLPTPCKANEGALLQRPTTQASYTPTTTLTTATRSRKHPRDDDAESSLAVERQAERVERQSRTGSKTPTSSESQSLSKKQRKSESTHTSASQSSGTTPSSSRSIQKSGLGKATKSMSTSFTNDQDPFRSQVEAMKAVGQMMTKEILELKNHKIQAETKIGTLLQRVERLEGDKEELKRRTRDQVASALERFAGAGAEIASMRNNLRVAAENFAQEADLEGLKTLNKEAKEAIKCTLSLERHEASKIEVLKAYQREVEARDGTIGLLRTRLEISTGECLEAKDRRAAVEAEIARLHQNEQRGMEGKTKMHENEMKRANDEIGSLKNQVGKGREELDLLLVKVARMEEDEIKARAGSEQALKECVGELNEERAERQRFEKLAKNQEQELVNLRSLRNRLAAAELQMASGKEAKAQVANMAKLVESLEAEIDREHRQFCALMGERLEMDQRIEDLEARVVGLEQELGECDVLIERLRIEGTQSKTQINLLQEEKETQRSQHVKERNAALSDKIELGVLREREMTLEKALQEATEFRQVAEERYERLASTLHDRERQKVDEVMRSMEQHLTSKENELKRVSARLIAEERAKQRAQLELAKLKQRPVIDYQVGSSPNGGGGGGGSAIPKPSIETGDQDDETDQTGEHNQVASVRGAAAQQQTSSASKGGHHSKDSQGTTTSTNRIRSGLRAHRGKHE